MKIWSLIPLLRYEEGHPYGYNLSVGKACLHNGWEHAAFVPVSCLIENMPPSWEKILGEDYFTAKNCVIIWKTPLQKLKSLLKTIIPLCKALKRIKKSDAPRKACLMEQFFLPQMVAFCIAALIVKPDCEIWLIHRYSKEQMGFKGKIYRSVHFLLSLRLGKGKLRLLTDSELLANSQEPLFRKKVSVLPIPHTEFCQDTKQEKDKDSILLWWPGGYTSKAKGLLFIQKLVKIDREGAQKFTLVVADSAQKALKESRMPIHFIKSHLPREEYMEWMSRADLILLPYSSDTYRYATSGIFVEAIVAGKIPVVTDDTWMAHELKRFHLGKLVLSRNDSDFLQRLEEIYKDPDIKNFLDKMQKVYSGYHSVEGFAKIIKAL